MAEEGHEESTQSGEFEALGGKLKGVYGFSMRMGLGGTPVIEQFGNIQETETGPVITGIREPLVDVMDEGDHLVVIVELPGIEEQNIQLKAEGDILGISASTRDRSYQKEVLLPWAVGPETLESSYRNGILEIRITKQ
jgi:HSP20 family protein